MKLAVGAEGGPVGLLQTEVATAFVRTETETGPSLYSSRVVAEETSTQSLLTLKRETKAERAAAAKIQGYEGEACGQCGNFTLVRNGTCLKCNTCGGTSGCS